MRVRADDRTELELSRRRDHLGEPVRAATAQLAGHTGADDRELARRPRDHRHARSARVSPRVDHRGRLDDGRRQRDERPPARLSRGREPGVEQARVGIAGDLRTRRGCIESHHSSSDGVATNSVHTPNASDTISSMSRPAARISIANSSGEGNAATERWR